MSMTRVWNVTNDPSTDVLAQNLMVLGKLLKPGQSMQVEEASLKTAHKVTKDVGLKLLAVGKTPPSYLVAGVKATLPVTVARAHGEVPVEAIAADAPAAVEDKLSEEKPEETKPSADSESTVSDASDNDNRGFGKSRRR
jgi:hypothetical protein